MVSEPAKMSSAARDLIATDVPLHVSAISAWEVGMLVSKSRIRLDRPVERWVADSIKSLRASPVSVDTRIGVLATMLPSDPPADPADRLIVATALTIGAALITPDRRILEYPYCPTVW